MNLGTCLLNLECLVFARGVHEFARVRSRGAPLHRVLPVRLRAGVAAQQQTTTDA